MNDSAVSIQHGTSQAAPVIVGVIAMMQQLHRKLRGTLPDITDLTNWLTMSATKIIDGDDENDNVDHTGREFLRVDAVEALSSVRKAYEMSILMANRGMQGSAFA